MPYFRKRMVRRIPRKRRIMKRKTVYRKKNRLTKLIKSVIHKQAETKQAYTTTGSSLIKFNGGVDNTGDMIQIMPNITNGTADNARIGDQLRAQSLNIKGYVKLDVNELALNQAMPNVIVRLMIVSLKTKPNYTEATSSATPLAGLLKKGGTTSNFTGALQDIYAPINTDLWTVHSDRKIYLTQSYVQQFGGGTTQLFASDVSKTVKFFNINVKCKNKLLKYDANISSGLLPTNFGPMLLLGYSFLNGSSPDSILTRVGLQFDSVFNYEDC